MSAAISHCLERARLQAAPKFSITKITLSFRSPSQPQSGEKGEEPAVCRHDYNAWAEKKRVQRTPLSVAFDVDFEVACTSQGGVRKSLP